MEKITKMSRVLKTFCFLGIWILPLFNLGFWITSGYPFLTKLGFDLSFIPHFSFSKSLTDLTFWQTVCGFWVTLIPVAFASLSFYWLTKLFALFHKMQIFSKSAFRFLRNFALTLMTSQLIYPFYSALISLVLTANNSVGERVVVVKFGLAQLVLLAVSYALLLISWIMREGNKIDEENKATI